MTGFVSTTICNALLFLDTREEKDIFAPIAVMIAAALAYLVIRFIINKKCPPRQPDIVTEELIKKSAEKAAEDIIREDDYDETVFETEKENR